MDQDIENAKDGRVAARAVELARKARLAQRTAAVFLRRWAVEQTLDNVGLVALAQGAIDLPASQPGPDALQAARES